MACLRECGPLGSCLDKMALADAGADASTACGSVQACATLQCRCSHETKQHATMRSAGCGRGEPLDAWQETARGGQESGPRLPRRHFTLRLRSTAIHHRQWSASQLRIERGVLLHWVESLSP
jgi:hypothetical protein